MMYQTTMKTIIFCLFVLTASPQVFAGILENILVGNGGEAIRVGQENYTRDLYEYGLHFHPYIGSEIVPEAIQDLQPWNPLNLPAEDLNLLSRKISDIHVLMPALASSLVEVILSYSWSFVDAPLVLLPDETRTVIPAKSRVTVANRYLQSIFIQRDEFNRMNSENRVALIIHEAVYSLSHIQSVDSEHLYQNLSSTRQVVARLFSKPNPEPDLFLIQSSLMFRNVGSQAIPCKKAKLKVWTFSEADGVQEIEVGYPFGKTDLEVLLQENFSTSLRQDSQIKTRTFKCIHYSLPAVYRLKPYVYGSSFGTQIAFGVLGHGPGSADSQCVCDTGDFSFSASSVASQIWQSLKPKTEVCEND